MKDISSSLFHNVANAFSDLWAKIGQAEVTIAENLGDLGSRHKARVLWIVSLSLLIQVVFDERWGRFGSESIPPFYISLIKDLWL